MCQLCGCLNMVPTSTWKPSSTKTVIRTGASSFDLPRYQCRFREFEEGPRRGGDRVAGSSRCRTGAADGGDCRDRLWHPENKAGLARRPAGTGVAGLASPVCRSDIRSDRKRRSCLRGNHGKCCSPGTRNVSARRHDRSDRPGKRRSPGHAQSDRFRDNRPKSHVSMGLLTRQGRVATLSRLTTIRSHQRLTRCKMDEKALSRAEFYGFFHDCAVAT